jgi:hypothetical protein
VRVSRSSGNSGLRVRSGASLTFTPGNWNYLQPVTVTASASGTGTAAFTATAPGYAAQSVTGNETVHGATGTRAHVVNPFTGAAWYVNPDYTAEVATSAAGASGTLKAKMLTIGHDIPAGQWFPAQFQQLIQNASPAVP